MAKLYPLFSGSSGNSIYIEHHGEAILIDAGRSAKQIENSLLTGNFSIKAIKAIFVTHEHSDHISGLRVFASRYNIKVYSSHGTINSMQNKGLLGKVRYDTMFDAGVQFDFMMVKHFFTSHDCEQSVGYTINLHNNIKICICTDLGYISESVESSVLGSNIVYIESNHDVNMLKTGKYPYFLKKRILSDVGHLSNEICANFLPKLVENGANKFILSHLSIENNKPEIAYQTALNALSQSNMMLNYDYTLDIAPRTNTQNYVLNF